MNKVTISKCTAMESSRTIQSKTSKGIMSIVDNRPQTIIQKMTKAAGEATVNTVKSNVQYAANRLFDIIATLGDSQNTRKLKDDILNSIGGLPFGTSNINDIADRASVCNITKGAVCDDYQEIAIAEMDHNGSGIGEKVYREQYQGHNYVSVDNPDKPDKPDNWQEDLIVDPWRNMVDLRKNFDFFRKYRDPIKRLKVNALAGTTNWLNPSPFINTFVQLFLFSKGINTGNLQTDIDTYKRLYPAHHTLKGVYPM